MVLSVIIPVYNGEKYVDKCIDSILKQNISDCEIIVVDDGSNDNTLKFLKNKYGMFKNIIITSKNNEGQGIARNYGLTLASGEYVCYIDSDDYFENENLKKLLEITIENKCDLGIGQFQKEYSNGDKVLQRLINDEKTILETENNQMNFFKFQIKTNTNLSFGSTACGKIYKRNILVDNNINFISERKIYSEDMIFNLNYLKHCKKVLYTNIVTFNYVMNDFSFTHRYQKDCDIKLNNMYDAIKEFVNNSDELSIIFHKKFFSYCKEAVINEYRYKKGNNLINKISDIVDIYNNNFKKNKKLSLGFSDKLLNFNFRKKRIFLIKAWCFLYTKIKNR